GAGSALHFGRARSPAQIAQRCPPVQRQAGYRHRINFNLKSERKWVTMITREQINELAQFEDHDSCALTYYFQPATPRNKAHKEEAILTKDLAREAMRKLESENVEGKAGGKTKEKLDS